MNITGIHLTRRYMPQPVSYTHLDVYKRQVYRRYEKGKYELPVWALIKLAKYYHTSTDYILGLTDNPKPYREAHKLSLIHI